MNPWQSQRNLSPNCFFEIPRVVDQKASLKMTILNNLVKDRTATRRWNHLKKQCMTKSYQKHPTHMVSTSTSECLQAQVRSWSNRSNLPINIVQSSLGNQTEVPQTVLVFSPWIRWRRSLPGNDWSNWDTQIYHSKANMVSAASSPCYIYFYNVYKMYMCTNMCMYAEFANWSLCTIGNQV